MAPTHTCHFPSSLLFHLLCLGPQLQREKQRVGRAWGTCLGILRDWIFTTLFFHSLYVAIDCCKTYNIWLLKKNQYSIS